MNYTPLMMAKRERRMLRDSRDALAAINASAWVLWHLDRAIDELDDQIEASECKYLSVVIY